MFIVSAAYTLPSVHGAITLRTVAYDIALDKSCEADTFSIAVISDFHVGAGARHSEMAQMVERVAAAKPELILIAGDVCDSASSVADLEYMEETLKKLSCPYGVYYAEGNHEVECRTDPEPYLLRAGITILCDRTLDESEKTDLVTLKYHTVHFSYIPKEWYGEMCARLPLPLPPEIKEKYVG